MDRIDQYRQILEKVLQKYAAFKLPEREIKLLTIIDLARDNYILMTLGWMGIKRYHQMIFHLRINNHKIYIEFDGTENGVTPDLLENGISSHEIVLAFHPEELRTDPDFAIN